MTEVINCKENIENALIERLRQKIQQNRQKFIDFQQKQADLKKELQKIQNENKKREKKRKQIEENKNGKGEIELTRLNSIMNFQEKICSAEIKKLNELRINEQKQSMSKNQNKSKKNNKEEELKDQNLEEIKEQQQKLFEAFLKFQKDEKNKKIHKKTFKNKQNLKESKQALPQTTDKIKKRDDNKDNKKPKLNNNLQDIKIDYLPQNKPELDQYFNQNYQICKKFGKFIENNWFVFFKNEFRLDTYKIDYYEQQRMKILLDNIITDDEPDNSLIIKKNNIRQLANEFSKEDIVRVNKLKALGQNVEYNPNMRLLEMAYNLEQSFVKK